MSPIKRRHHGQSAVELAVFMPVMLLILMIAVDFGRVFMGWININNMARIGANYAALNAQRFQAGDGAASQRYRDLMAADSSPEYDACPLPGPNFNGYTFRAAVTVTITCDFSLLTPFLSNIIGDGSGNVPISATAVFNVRTGSPSGQAVGGVLPPLPVTPTPVPPPTPTPTPVPIPTATPPPAPGGSPDPNATPVNGTPEPTPLPAVTVDFYGSGTNTVDSSGGGPSPSRGFETIIGLPPLEVAFSNQTRGQQVICLWDFGDGTTDSSCGNTVTKTYATRGLYTVTLTVNGSVLSKPGYVLVSCKVPAFSGMYATSAKAAWVAAGFQGSNFSSLRGGNFIVEYQSLSGGLINPPGGCSGATVVVGPAGSDR